MASVLGILPPFKQTFKKEMKNPTTCLDLLHTPFIMEVKSEVLAESWGPVGAPPRLPTLGCTRIAKPSPLSPAGL